MYNPQYTALEDLEGKSVIIPCGTSGNLQPGDVLPTVTPATRRVRTLKTFSRKLQAPLPVKRRLTSMDPPTASPTHRSVAIITHYFSLFDSSPV